jgi:hypothetical protein
MDELKRKPYKRLSPDELMAATRSHLEGIPVSTLAQQFQISERQLHRLLKNQSTASNLSLEIPEASPRSRHVQPFIQEFHSAWLFEELVNDPRVTLDHLAAGLNGYFNLDVSTSTIWRHIRGGGLEGHGFPGFTRSSEDALASGSMPV